MSPWQTRFIDEIIPLLMVYLKICFWSVIYTPVILHSQWRYWWPSLHKRYPLYKFPSHAISSSWDISRGWGVYTPLTPTSQIPCMLTIVAKNVYVKIKLNLCRNCLPIYVVVLPCNFTGGNISYYMFCIFSFASKFYNAQMNIPRMYLPASS